MGARSRTLTSVLVLLVASAPPGALAQLQVRARSTTTAQLIQLRPLVFDSTNTLIAGDRQSATPLVQDLEATAWGFGVRGLRISSMARLRGALGSDLVWPRSSDHFDLLWAFAELDLDRWRLRAGRVLRPGPLGFTGFDGASALWRPARWVRAEAYGGRSLARGFNDPGTSGAIAAVDSFLPNDAVLVGGLAAWAEVPGAAFGAAYQREVTSGFDALVSERAAFDARVRLGAHTTVLASTNLDLGSDAWGSARASVLVSPTRTVSLDAAVFRYRPFFALNTIWGVFAPQAHWGGRLAADARLGTAWRVDASYTMRRYGATTATTPFLAALEDHSSIIQLGGQYAAGPVSARAAWRLTQGYGGAQSGGDLGVDWVRNRDWQAGVTLSAFQESEQLRAAGGTVVGLGAHGRARLGARASVRGQLTHWSHNETRDGSAPDWSQLRAMIAVELTFGANADRAAAMR